jgi:hypothetical protein
MGMIFSKYACGCLETDCPLCPYFSDLDSDTEEEYLDDVKIERNGYKK